ncbi:hypothetical protein L5515_000972 [Caenorhabditis briggsae]|uniref:Uncharacterized protein n=1 Tax=Caenorhabditis briggsae TaxID=6238 RepID=A0AAE9DUJ9_CAEBR|nr:hypothetical protein L3Y34_014896 [Caenorhabditis briggsae]UMM11953.1 hypothetical protein L5515_000972 [Caenorhabditis briggsae]
MKKGKFLIVNEPNEETIDHELKVSTENCDVYSALVYIPKFNKKMEKGLFCVLALCTQIALFGLMAYFFKIGYLAFIPFELFFFVMYGKENVWNLDLQIIYLFFQLFFAAFTTFLAFGTEGEGTRKDFGWIAPDLETGTLALFGAVFGIFTILRLLLVASYRTHLFYSNLRDKFMDGKVVLQPV